MSAELSARQTAAAAVLGDFQRATSEYATGALVNPDWLAWAMRLAQSAQQLLTVPAGAELEPGRLAAIRAVVDQVLNDELADRQYALERIEQISAGSRTASGPESGGGAHLTEPDLRTALDALDVAADYKRDRAANCPDCDASPADLCGTCEWRLAVADGYDALARRIGGAQ